jgi:hypothetical protein
MRRNKDPTRLQASSAMPIHCSAGRSLHSTPVCPQGSDPPGSSGLHGAPACHRLHGAGPATKDRSRPANASHGLLHCGWATSADAGPGIRAHLAATADAWFDAANLSDADIDAVIAYLGRVTGTPARWSGLPRAEMGHLPQQACRRQVLVDVSNYLARTGYAGKGYGSQSTHTQRGGLPELFEA